MIEIKDGVPYQFICEDSKTKVYIALEQAPEKKHRKSIDGQIIKDIGLMLLNFVLTAMISLGFYNWISLKLTEARGHFAIGGEIFLLGIVAYVTFQIINIIEDFIGERLWIKRNWKKS